MKVAWFLENYVTDTDGPTRCSSLMLQCEEDIKRQIKQIHQRSALTGMNRPWYPTIKVYIQQIIKWNKINNYLIFIHIDQLFNHPGESRF
jgi:hypothetical protein